MKPLKETIVFTFEMLRFFFISVPVFLVIYFEINLIYELKNLKVWKMK